MATSTYVALATQTVSSTVTTVTFSSIPSTYTDIVLVGSVRGAGFPCDPWLYVNGDTSTNYSRTFIYGSGGSFSSGRASNSTRMNTDIVNAAPTAANTFATFTAHFQNYSNTTTNKTVLTRYVNASDETTASVNMWRSTAAINSISVNDPNGVGFASGSTFTIYGIAAENTSFSGATGGTLYSDATYNYHVFTSSGIFEIIGGTKACDVLIVAGGGGGGSNQGGGGGAGGMYELTSQTLIAGKNIVLIGAGGAGSTSNIPNDGTNGSNTTFGGFAPAIGGGRGATYSLAANSGGSGGGSSGGTGTGGAGTSGQGNSGGSSGWYGAGGGGKSAAGTTTPAANNAVPGAGNGGAGATSSISGGSVTGAGQLSSGSYYFAGGGGGGSTGANLGGAPGSGGVGGGGQGQAQNYNSPAVAGAANTGGGGGGGNQGGSGYNSLGTAGGSGIVIVRYAR